jgi:hypothetical protein
MFVVTHNDSLIIIVIAYIARNTKRFTCSIPNRREFVNAACERRREIGRMTSCSLPPEDRIEEVLEALTEIAAVKR